MRVVFLVEEHEQWQAMLDAIFADCYGRWGGRFNLLVPCENKEVRAACLPWLEAYDPDVIYSYVDLSTQTLAQLHERLCPSFLIRHEFYRGPPRDLHAFRPKLPLEGLGSLTVSVAASRGSALFEPQPVSIVDTHLGTKPSRFLQENFGCYGQSLRPWPMARDIQHQVRPLTFVPEQIRANRHIAPRAEGEVVGSESELLEKLAKKRHLYGLAQLSAWQTPRLEMRDRRWGESISIVIGDSYADSLIFWNARSHLPVWVDSGILILKTDAALVHDEGLFDNLLAIIKNRIQFHPSNNSMTHLVLRSASLDIAELEKLRDRFRAADKFNLYTSEHVVSVDDCVPNAETLADARPHVEGGSLFQADDWHEIVVSEQKFRPTAIPPRHIRDVQSLPRSLRTGVWALDLDIERSVDHSQYQNIHHHWRLPRRLRLETAFTRGYELGRHGPICLPRVQSGGFLTVFASINSQLPEIKEPSDETAFRTVFCAPYAQWPFTRKYEDKPANLVYDMRPSDKGKYLIAVLRMADGLTRAKQIFLQKFWRERFGALGANPAAGEERIPQIVQTLKKRLRSGTMATEADWERTAGIVLSEARNLKSSMGYLRYDFLAEKFEEYRRAYWATHEAAAPRDEWDEDERRSLADSIQYLCECEILHQGHEWRCRHCYNSNWVSIDALTSTIGCEVCGSTRPAPVAEPWHFKLNGFVLEAIRDHGVGASVWCLGRLQEMAKASFYFMEPQELFLTRESVDAGKPDAEIDVLAVTDGTVRLCEVKSSQRDVDVEKLASLALRFRPNCASLAIMEPDSASLDAKLVELRKRLDGSGIASELISLAPHDIEETPLLPTGRRFGVRLF